MPPSRHSLSLSIGLAALSGALAWPLIQINAWLSPYPGYLNTTWVMVAVAIFSLLVLAPFVRSHRFRSLRLLVLVAGSILVFRVAFAIPAHVEVEIFGAAGPFILAGIAGSVLIAVLVWLVAPLEVAPRYWSLAIVAGLIGGLVFYRALASCGVSECGPWSMLPILFGWIIWQVLVGIALHIGSETKRPASTPGLQGF